MVVFQDYKGDETELKYKNAGSPAYESISDALDEMMLGASTTDDFILMLYDDGRYPYSQRIKRDAFVNFIRGALNNFPFIGSFDTYIFILREIFGPDTDLIFTVPGPGELEISVNASSDIVSEFIGREVSGGGYVFFNLSDDDGNDIVFKTLAGIETEAELNLLFAEIMPAGIFPTIALDFFLKSTFYGEDTGGVFDMITSFDDNFIFIEVGG